VDGAIGLLFVAEGAESGDDDVLEVALAGVDDVIDFRAAAEPGGRGVAFVGGGDPGGAAVGVLAEGR
jgi:hypothetical protein